MTLASTYNFWSVAGLVYAFAGASLICNAVFLIAPPSQRLASPGAPEVDRTTLRRQSQQWLDTRVGAVLVAIGFFLQATGAVGTSTLNTPAVFVLLALAMFSGYYAMARDLMTEDMVSADVVSAHKTIEDASPAEPKIAPQVSATIPDENVVEAKQSDAAE
ncbi:MAG: hypothetical protein JSR78_14210 [Proteobacteria bacterium]|nr:hypothetical protein [Pseudomonadota bacterium]